MFRESVRCEAERLGVAGWVRNLSDGRVEVVLEGDEQAVEDAAAWCNEGPKQAVVSHVEVRVEAPQGDTGFRVLR